MMTRKQNSEGDQAQEGYMVLQSKIKSEVSESQPEIIDLASEKSASSWLTSLPSIYVPRMPQI